MTACLLRTAVSPAKMTEPIYMPFGVVIRVGPKNHVLDESAQLRHLVN